eukprot:2200436-Rhodomonas_salina.1
MADSGEQSKEPAAAAPAPEGEAAVASNPGPGATLTCAVLPPPKAGPAGKKDDKVRIFVKNVGNAPILKVCPPTYPRAVLCPILTTHVVQTTEFSASAASSFSRVIQVNSAALVLPARVHLFVNQSFSPSPDEQLGDLFKVTISSSASSTFSSSSLPPPPAPSMHHHAFRASKPSRHANERSRRTYTDKQAYTHTHTNQARAILHHVHDEVLHGLTPVPSAISLSPSLPLSSLPPAPPPLSPLPPSPSLFLALPRSLPVSSLSSASKWTGSCRSTTRSWKRGASLDRLRYLREDLDRRCYLREGLDRRCSLCLG